MSIDENSIRKSMNECVDGFSSELKKVRTGRVHVAMLDSVQVSYYGNMTPLNQVASISCPDARSFLISPWESSTLKDIEAAIVKSNLGMSPQNDGKFIRLKVPELTEQRRLDLIKQIKKMAEDRRVSLRMIRRDTNEKIKEKFKDKEIGEDQKKTDIDLVQKIIDDYIKKVDTICEKKEADLKTI